MPQYGMLEILTKAGGLAAIMDATPHTFAGTKMFAYLLLHFLAPEAENVGQLLKLCHSNNERQNINNLDNFRRLTSRCLALWRNQLSYIEQCRKKQSLCNGLANITGLTLKFYVGWHVVARISDEMADQLFPLSTFSLLFLRIF